uniref:exodeoxyribonuclease III n=1 Tax=Oryzias sinensis TaxID=183150 RepID=A0A8C7WNB4_9TELE
MGLARRRGTLTILSLNVRGLNNNIKRVKCQQLMHRQKADVVLIQESHLRQGDVSKIQDKQYKMISSSSSSSKSKGVIIVFKRNLPTKIEKTYSDNLGRLTYVCTTIYDTKIAFVAIYAPTIFEKNFYPSVMQELLTLSEYKMIIGGDMNAVSILQNASNSFRKLHG